MGAKMNYEFNNEYLTKSLISLVRDEGSRIMNANLASHDNVSSTLEFVVEKIADRDIDAVLNSLATLHGVLLKVKLPGDFEKVSSVIKRSFGIEDEVEPEPEVEDDDTIDESAVFAEIDEEHNNLKTAILDKLASVVYDLGANGNHAAAYIVERKMHEIEVLAAGPTPMTVSPIPQTQQPVAQQQQNVQQQSLLHKQRAQLQQILGVPQTGSWDIPTVTAIKNINKGAVWNQWNALPQNQKKLSTLINMVTQAK